MKVRIIIAITMIFGFNSCSEFLVVEPDSQVSILEQFSTRVGIEQAVNGLYYMSEELWSDKFFVYGDLMGGNLTFSPSEHDAILEIPTARDIDQIYEFRDMADESAMEGVYVDAYAIINAVNLVIEHSAENELLTAEEIQEIKAEALACRATMHFIVASYYAQNYSYTEDASHPGIIYNTSAIVAGKDFPERLTMAESYEKMKADFEEALSLFTGKPFLTYGLSNTYFNAMTTSSLFARVALQMNDFEAAIKYADTVINYSGLTLTPDTLYVKEWEDTTHNMSETIFELSTPTSDEGIPSSSVSKSLYKYVDRSNYNEFVASGDLLELYSQEDIRSAMFLEVLLATSVNGIIADEPYFFTRKFQTDKAVPVTRLSEMYLIRAEAAARLRAPDYVSALADLNMIRERAGLAALGSDADVLEEIFQERRRELAFENHLFFDIARYHKDIVREKGCLSSVCTLEYPSDYYVLPIPEDNVLLNENMDQNDGY